MADKTMGFKITDEMHEKTKKSSRKVAIQQKNG